MVADTEPAGVPVGIAPAEGERPEGSRLIPVLCVAGVLPGCDEDAYAETAGLEEAAVRISDMPTKMGADDPLAVTGASPEVAVARS